MRLVGPLPPRPPPPSVGTGEITVLDVSRAVRMLLGARPARPIALALGAALGPAVDKILSDGEQAIEEFEAEARRIQEADKSIHASISMRRILEMVAEDEAAGTSVLTDEGVAEIHDAQEGLLRQREAIISIGDKLKNRLTRQFIQAQGHVTSAVGRVDVSRAQTVSRPENLQPVVPWRAGVMLLC